ncbi:MAG TPA: dipeptidase PepV [Candidatus Mcinerneyibacterium sp.]|nr:dipeptidase PepV [Candidatus Mcinerneyibacterium sp.]
MKDWIKSNENRILSDLEEFIKIKSVQKQPKKNKPFGEGVDEALKFILKYAENLGFKTKNLDNYIGFADWGEGSEMLGILCHVDIVPEGSGWNTDPYKMEIKDNKIIGRGVLDDKGPTILILNAVKYLMENDIYSNKKIRIIFGTNEESGWKGIEYYLENEKEPDIAFTPDAEFPVIFAEKGILHFKLKSDFKNDDIKEIKGGNAPNMVPNEAYAVVKNVYKFENKKDIEIIEKENVVKIKAHGTSAHASTPHLGDNAISKLINYLNNYIKDPFLDFYEDKIGLLYNGENIDVGFEDEISGKLTFNTGIIDNQGVVVDIRYPVSVDKEQIEKNIRNNLEKGINYEEIAHKNPLHVSKDSDLVQELMTVYNDIMEDNQTPIAIGGGTYARAVKKGVAFGPLFPKQEEVAHQANEYFEKDKFFKSLEIYIKGIKKLIT